MDEAQKFAVNTYMEELCDVIKSDLFLPPLRIKGILDESECHLISCESTNKAKVFKCLRLLIPKANGWEATVRFLEKHKCLQLVEKLRCSVANHLCLQIGQVEISLDWHQFICDVVDFYLGDYRVVESFDVDGDSEAIESVWVDLQMEGSRESFSDYKEIFAQMRAKKCRLAIVRGQPGSGKTTLAKKIAYDWAKEEKKEIFDLILAVPLRNVLPKSDLLEMAVGLHLGNDDDIKRICADLRREKLKILIVLDGLDEFQIPPDSFLSQIFGSGQAGVKSFSAKPTKFNFDLIVTSRPFACQLIHSHIMAVKFEIVGFSEGKQVEFVRRRCKKPNGKATAIEYLRQSGCVKEICQNPFLLSFICFLSDMGELIPSTLTQLYSTFVHRMLIRDAQKNAVGNKFYPSNWQQSDLLKHLGSLALLGVIKSQFQFNQDEMQMCHVVKEHFHSGLLQYRSDPVGLVLKCDFPHRSIQDFLAAFYAVYYWSDRTLTEATSWPHSIWPKEFVDLIPLMKVGMLIARVITTDSQYCRFFFGLKSGCSRFSSMFQSVLEDVIISFYPTFPLNIFLYVGIDMADCSHEEILTAGRICNDKVIRIDDQQLLYPTKLQMKKLFFARWEGVERKSRDYSLASLYVKLTDSFCQGFKLTRTNDNSTVSFAVGTENLQHLKSWRLFAHNSNFQESVGNLLQFKQVDNVDLRLFSSIRDNNEAIQQILARIPSIDKLDIFEVHTSIPVLLGVAVVPQHTDFPTRFTLKFLLFGVERDVVKKMLEKFRSAKLLEQNRVTSVMPRVLGEYVTIHVSNDLSNLDLWNFVVGDG